MHTITIFTENYNMDSFIHRYHYMNRRIIPLNNNKSIIIFTVDNRKLDKEIERLAEKDFNHEMEA